MRETREISIDGTVYQVTQLGTRLGRKHLVTLLKFIGPGIGTFIGSLGRAPGSGDAALEAGLAAGAGEALHELSGRLNEAQLVEVMDDFAKYTVVVVSPELSPRLLDIFEDHFAGRYDLLARWFMFCLQINYQSFFVGADSRKGALIQMWKALSAFRSPAASTGTSTESPAASTTATA